MVTASQSEQFTYNKRRIKEVVSDFSDFIGIKISHGMFVFTIKFTATWQLHLHWLRQISCVDKERDIVSRREKYNNN